MRWKFVIPALILVLLVAAFNIFFFDRILKHFIVAGGQKIFAAKVEVARVKTRFSNLSIDISGVQVADRNDPFKNLFEFGSVRFALKPLPLLSKKVVIEEMALEGVRWGTRRTTSGALPPAKVAKIDRENEKESKNTATDKLLAALKQKATVEFSALPSVQSIANAQKDLGSISLDKVAGMAGLSAPREIEAMQAGLQQKYAGYQTQIQGLNVNDTVNRAATAIADVQKIRIDTPQDIANAQQRIQALNQSKDELQKMLDTAKSLQSSLSTDLGQQADIVKKIDDLKNKDIQNVQSKLKLPSLSMGNVSNALFGPLWVSRVDRFVYYAQTVRKYMPPRKKDDTKIVKKRMRGTIVSFPSPSMPPDFLIQRIALSGSTGGPGKDGTPLDFKGTVENITSDPVLLGRPILANIDGSQGTRRLTLKGTFDHTREVAVDGVHLELTGLDAKDLSLPSSDFLPSFEKGVGAVSSDFTLSGGTLDSGLQLALSNIQANPALQNQSAEVQSLLSGLWTGINAFSVKATMNGTPENLNMTVTSDIDKILGERLSKLYGEKLNEVQTRIRAEIDRQTNDAKNKLLAEYGSQKDALQKQLNAKQNELQAQINAAQEQVKQKENEIRGQADREKQKAQDELKRKAQEELKNRVGGQFDNLFK